jgi:cobalt-zinc-cadmium efflux system membrane fusion protein
VREGTRDLPAVPAAAVQRVGEPWVVIVPQRDDTFAVRAVGRGRDLGTEVEIATGLNGSETVVVDGAFLLKAEAEKAVGGDEHGHQE